MEFHVLATQQDYMELGRTVTVRKSLFRRKPTALFLAVLAVSVVLLVVFLLLPKPAGGGRLILHNVIIQLLGAEIALIGLYFLLWKIVELGYKRLYSNAEKFGALNSALYLSEAGVRTKTEDGSEDMFFAWKAVTRLVVSKNLYIFITRGNMAVFLGRRFVPPQWQPCFDAWMRYAEGFGMVTEWRV